MSWQDYVSNLEKGNGKCKYAVLAGKEGGVWAESSNKDQFCLDPTEISHLTKVLLEQKGEVLSDGLMLHSNKFTCLRLEPDVLVAQGKGDAKDYSLVAAVSNQAVIVGFNPDSDVKAANVRDGVEAMKDYLKNMGY